MSVEMLLTEAILAAAAERRGDGALIVGLCGSQGSGKSTVAASVAARIPGTAVLSLDDLYLTRAERVRLGEQVHPLLSTRGVPGTHDVDLGIEVLDAVARGRSVALPRFSKRLDDSLPMGDWPLIPPNMRILIFEGWCVGATPQSAEALIEPVNALERGRDREGIWRRYVNDRLATDYQRLFSRLDQLFLLAAPGWETVPVWRRQQEDQLRTAGRAGVGIMTDTQLAEFVSGYERLTRHILHEMPDRADVTVHLNESRDAIAVSRR